MNYPVYLQKKPREKNPRGQPHSPLSVRAVLAEAADMDDVLEDLDAAERTLRLYLST